MKELLEIQSELNAPKNQYNKFGGFNYRNAEDILEAVKPLLKKKGCILTISDEVVNIGERYYVKATAVLSRADAGAEETVIGVTAYAREQEEKKGMDASQITGSTSSYARKYALAGLFAIDDGRDADSMNNKEEGSSKESVSFKSMDNRKATMAQVKYLKSLGFEGEFESMSFREADKQIKLLQSEA